MTTFNGSRLRIARERRGWSASRLSRELGTTLRTVQRWEGGDVTPTESSIDAVAEFLDFRSSFFFLSDVEDIPVDRVSFRAASKMTAGSRNGVISAGRIGTEISGWIQNNFVVPNEELPTLTGYDPEMAAEVMRARWGLGQQPIKNLLPLAESHGIRAFALDQAYADVDAFSFMSRSGPTVFLNTSKTGERQRFDLAHELGHLVLHQEHVSASSRSIEMQAHRFASAFLMPRADVVSQRLWRATMPAVLQAKGRWRVSAMALAHRLKELDMLTEWSYRDLCINLAKEGYRTREEFRPISPESSLLFKKLLSTNESRSKFLKLGKELGLTDREFKRYIYGLAPTSVTPPLGATSADNVESTNGSKPARLTLVQSSK